jgi:hypothetical protein
MKRSVLASALVAGALVSLPAAGAQAATTCTTVLSNQTISGPLEVPSGAGCALVGDHVNGNIKIDPGAALSLGTTDGNAGNTIAGNITGAGIQAFDSYLPSSRISGSLTLTGVSGVPELGPLAPFGSGLDSDSFNYLDGLRVGGATSITGGGPNAPWTDDNTDNFSGAFTYASNAGALTLHTADSFGGTVSLRGNTGGGTVGSLRVGGSLLCGNAPLFTINGSLSVSGFNGAAGGTC